MLKNIRVTPLIASSMSRARVRSPTKTSAPSARSASARSSSRWTMARTGAPLSSSDSTTSRLTPPTPPPAPVIKYTTSLCHRPYRRRDQIASVQPCRTMPMNFEVLLVGHHVDECCGRRILNDDDRVPRRLLAVTDDDRGRGAGVTDQPSHPLEMRRDFTAV